MENRMKNVRYYICPTCGNVIVAASQADIACCGRPVPLAVAEKAAENEKMMVEIVEDERFLTTNHPMTKEDYITFTIFVTGEKLNVTKHFPEWNLEMRIPKNQHGKLLWYSKSKGFRYQLL